MPRPDAASIVQSSQPFEIVTLGTLGWGFAREGRRLTNPLDTKLGGWCARWQGREPPQDVRRNL
jgi:hypothetical protein